ncbi:DUF6415 family natural product biosynthesis protein [Streptomyces sp. LP05-1]|uniref:DUF6415 family natural product biosynthesis protein n=1 Tax=Streptomyces pyxinae TaxID=2970734 RepID=A0ABT2CEU0_9ACTN|nr:DUF6415 family natural product biosynthesis protein [Streptomyces sp. LP05-1]MCS0635934.1 DUF6415 family natural product biosynthesis protein [Streptomyces sp. LP05-1]
MADLLRVGQPVEPLYDVLELLLGPSGALADAEIEGLVGRLQGVPGRLAAVVVEWFKGRPEGRAGRLVERARALERDDEAVAVGGPLGYLRRLAVVTEGLLDVLLEGAPPVVVA